MTDTAFRRLVKRRGGCGLVVTEMVSSEGLVRGIDRTLEYAEYTEEERPVSIQIFGGDPERVAEKVLYWYELFRPERLLLQLSVGTLPHARVLRAIELLGTEVLPRVERALRPPAGG